MTSVYKWAMELDLVIAKLAAQWVFNHSENYAPMDAKPPKWSKLLKRAYLFDPRGKPTVVDRFFAPIAGHAATLWTLCDQLIGPCYSWVGEIESLEEYQLLWARGLQLADQYRAETGRHPAHLPWLWTLEAPPPHLL